MGLRPLEVSRWLEVDGDRAADLRLKAELLTSAHDRVVAVLPGSEDAGRELLDEIVDHLGHHHPGLVRRRPDGVLEEGTTGAVVDPGRFHPVDAAARLVQEDLCLMTGEGDGWVLAAASVCFPSRWRLADKIGRELLDIHRPVAGYETALDRPVRSFFDRLRPDRPMWRLNWTLLDSPDLHQPDAEDRRGPSPDRRDPGKALWFRVERQTLRRLTPRPAITFTIRTYVTSLERLVADHPEVVAPMMATLPTVPPAALAYKGWADLVRPVLAWLATVG
jgi:hypothetical protein